MDANCQVFRVCTHGSTYGFQSFICPNGTLFNQAVTVCDWWMNVKCEASQKYISDNNEKYANLKLGPHMMNDIKNMLTYPIKNPYDKGNIKSNYVVMQEYRPPPGQLFPNSAIRAGYERALNNANIPAKQTNFNQIYKPNDNNIISASTPNPQYVPATYTNKQNNQRDIETLQRQTKSGQYVQSNDLQNNRLQSTFSNGHTGFNTQFVNTAYGSSNTQTRENLKQLPRQYSQPQQNKPNQAYSTQNVYTNNFNQANSKYRDNRIQNQQNSAKQTEFGIEFKKEAYTYPSPQNTKVTSSQQFSNEHSGQLKQINEAKQNLVSESLVPTTVITKTLTFDRLVKGTKQANPSSRLTFKSWVVKPSKTARLISEPTPYVYSRPTNLPSAKLISEPTPYYYNKPTTISDKLVSNIGYVYNRPTTVSEKIVSDSGYVYNKPTTKSEKIVSNGGYVYNKPTAPAQLIVSSEPPRLYIPPVTRRPTAATLYLPPTTVRPTLSGRLYLEPPTPNPTLAARLYIPPTQNTLSRQYLGPNVALQPIINRNADLQVSPTAPTPVYLTPEGNSVDKPSFTLLKHSLINTNHNNLTFTDILTKEKLDITVHDIVKDTSKVLGTAPTEQLGQLRQANEDIEVDYPEDNYLPPENPDDSVESIIPSISSNNDVKSGKLVVSPSTELEPPAETFENNEQNGNPLVNLPFYKESNTFVPNTIERTVSLKISIPERTAEYLFKNNNDSEFDKLEILNTGSSNYLVLTNQGINKVTNPNFIPIGKLVFNKSSNFSNSQDLVYSFIADSLNVAKEYQNYPKNEDVSPITDKVSQLTYSQYGQNNQVNTKANVLQSTSDNRSNIKFSPDIKQNQAAKLQVNPSQTQSTSLNDNNSVNNALNNNQNAKLQSNKDIYSGQLYKVPVPDVSSQIYNNKDEDNFVALINEKTRNREQEEFEKSSEQVTTKDSGNKQSSAEVEIIKSHSPPISAPAKLQQAPTSDTNLQLDDTTQQLINSFINENGITAQLRDKIESSIRHPNTDKKITYKKDKSYYVYTKSDNNINNRLNTGIQTTNNNEQRSGKLIQGNNGGNVVTLQFIPSVSYQIEDADEQQKFLNKFQINEYGSPRQNIVTNNNGYQNSNRVILTDVDYTVDHSLKQTNAQYRNPDTLYAGPSSYSAPQGTVGQLNVQQQLGKLIANPIINNNYESSRLEQFNEDSGYAKVNPSPQFSF